MKKPDIPTNEVERMAALNEFNILDSLPEQAFDDIVFIASQICQVSIALISLVDTDRQWFKAKVGLEVQETPRDYSFCAHAINTPNDFFEVRDTHLDARFTDNPLVEGEPNIRFYAAIPLKVSDDIAIGTLCVADQEKGQLSNDQIQALRALSRQAISQLTFRKENIIQLRENEVLSKQIDDQDSELLSVKQKYELLYHTSPVMMASIDPQTAQVKNCNETLATVLGYSRSEVLQKDLFDLYHPDCHDKVKMAFAEFQATGVLNDKRLVLRTSSGEKIDVALNVSAARDKHGKILHSNSVWRDITGLIDAEKKLQEANNQLSRKVEERTTELRASNQRLERALDGSQDAIWDWLDVEKNEVWWSPNFFKLLGYQQGEINPGREFFFNTLLHPSDIPMVHQIMERSIKDQESFDFECRLRTKSGEFHWFRFRGRASVEEGGNNTSMSGSISSIHEQKMLKLELSEAKKFLTKVTDLVPSIIYVFNQKTMSNEYTNREIGKVMGFSDKEIQAFGAELMPKLCHPDDLPGMIEYFGSVQQMRDDEILQLEYRMMHKDGHYRWLLSIDTAFERDNDGKVEKHIGVATDITRLKEIEAERTKQNAELELKNRELQQLAYIATHDLKVPILNIEGHFDYLKKEMPKNNEDVVQSIGFVEDGILQFKNTIEGLTNLFKLKSEKVALRPVNLTEVFNDLIPSFSSEIEELGGRLTVAIDPNVNIVGSKMFCYSIFRNLIGNAIKYRSSTRNLEVQITGEVCEEDRFMIAVEDNGIGMDLELHHDQLFGMFKRFHDHVEGTGMGLHMTKLMVESKGGTIDVESTVGKGSRFIIQFKRIVQ